MALGLQLKALKPHIRNCRLQANKGIANDYCFPQGLEPQLSKVLDLQVRVVFTHFYRYLTIQYDQKIKTMHMFSKT